MQIEPKILYEDNHIIVVVKPHNISVQEDESKDIDMLTIIKNFIKERDKKPGNVFVGLVHRLDRPTGGVMVFAKTSKAAARLSAELKSKQMQKTYLTVICGKPQIANDQLVTYLKKDEKTNTVSIAPKTEEGAKQAILNYQVLGTKSFTENGQDTTLSLLEINLVTGRSHQIRVQMSKQLNAPVYADFKYGDKTHKGNLALWAYKLEFVHPTTKQNMVFKVEPDYNNSIFEAFKLDIQKLI